MRPNLLYTVLFSLSSFIANAQNRPATFSLRAEAGPSFPVGQFAGTNYNNFDGFPDPEGLAKTGVSFSVIPAFTFENKFSLLLQTGGSFYERERSGQETFYKMIYGVPGTINITRSTWKIFKLMPGISYSFNPNKSRFTLEPRVSLGLVKTKLPGHTVTLSAGGTTYFTRTVSDNDIPAAFCFELAGTGEYRINDRIGVYCGMNYFDATAKDEVVVNNPVIETSETFKVRHDLNNLGILAGIRVRL